MIKKGILNYLKCLKYYFVPLGIFSIFFVIGLFIGITGITNAVKDFMNNVAEITKATTINWNAMWNSLLGEAMKIDYSSGISDIIAQVTNVDWLKNTLWVVCKATFGDTLPFDKVMALAETTMSVIINYVMVFFAFLIIGLVVGIAVTRILIRKSMTKVKIGKLILYTLLDVLFWSTLSVAFYFLGTISTWVSITVNIIFILLFGFLSLVEGYLFYGIKKVKFKEVANIKNILKLYLIELIILLIAAGTTALLILIFKLIVGLYIALPFIEIALLCIGLTAESFVVEYKEQKEKKAIA